MISLLIWRSVIFLCCIKSTFALYCVKHHSGRFFFETCNTSKNRPISAAALSNKLDSTYQPNNLTFDLNCVGSNSECQNVRDTITKATDIISDIFQFEAPLVLNASYVSFCQVYQDCHHDSKYASIGQAYPSISYIMVDSTDNITRMYPQPLLKQFTNLSVKPSWTQYDIEAQFNNEINWYFVNDPNPIQNNQTDFLRNVIHELMHGLGFMTSWTDDFYYSLLPLFDKDKLNHFISPTLLAQTDNQQNLSNYNANQPFWGFVEFPFDKFIAYANKSTYSFFSETTRQLNNFANSNATFRNVIDLANSWYNSKEYVYSKQLYSKAVTHLDVLAVINNEPVLWLESSVDPFSSGSSLCHVDQSEYLNSTEYLMVYLANAGVSTAQLDNTYPQGPIGPKLLKVMSALGYRLDSKYNLTTTRPPLNYWGPGPGLVGTASNPSPSLAIDTNGPASMPTSSSSVTGVAASSATRAVSVAVSQHPLASTALSSLLICLSLLL